MVSSNASEWARAFGLMLVTVALTVVLVLVGLATTYL